MNDEETARTGDATVRLSEASLEQIRRIVREEAQQVLYTYTVLNGKVWYGPPPQPTQHKEKE